MSSFQLDEFKSLFAQSDNPHDDVVAMARTAEAAERYEDMCKFIAHLVEMSLNENKPLTQEERNLLSVAYKNVIGTRRASWRTLSAEAESADSDHAGIVAKYNAIVEDELVRTCNEVLKILDDLIPTVKDDTEASVFYLKMAGDYYRYLAESVSNDASYPKKAERYYQDAYEKATGGDKPLVPTHPVRLGLALNYSVCHYEILKNKQAACDLAKQAFDDAIAKLDKLEESDYKDSTLIMQLLRDNLTLWTASEGTDPVTVEDVSDDEN